MDVVGLFICQTKGGAEDSDNRAKDQKSVHTNFSRALGGKNQWEMETSHSLHISSGTVNWAGRKRRRLRIDRLLMELLFNTHAGPMF